MADVSSIKYSSSASVNVKYPQGRADIKDIQMYIGMDDPHMTGIYADFTNNIFRRIGGGALLQPGSDFDIYNMYSKRGRCTVDDFGNITSWYGDNDYAEDGSMGQVMVYQPKFYYKVIPYKLSDAAYGNAKNIEVGVWYISDEKLDGFKCHPAFIDDNGNETDGYFIGAFEASVYDTSELEYRVYDTWNVEHTEGTSTYRVVSFDAYPYDSTNDILCSIAGVKPASGKYASQYTRAGAHQMAKNRGSKWGTLDIKILSAEQLLFIVEYGSFNAQTTLFQGYTNVGTSGENIGAMTGSTVGNTTGRATYTYYLTGTGVYVKSNTNNKISMNYRGVENHWGSMRNYVEGINIYGDGTMQAGTPYICSDHDYSEEKSTGNYVSTGFVQPYANNQYISRFGYNADFDWAFIPNRATGANSTFPVGDLFQPDSDHVDRYLIVESSGFWNDGYSAGMFFWYGRNDKDNVSHQVGARLVRYDSTPEQVLGLHADFENNTFTRLAGASGKSAGSDFDEYDMYKNRGRCTVADDGTVIARYGEQGYVEDGSAGQVMVFQPKFYYKVEPVKKTAIVENINPKGYHLDVVNYYISNTPRTGFKCHPAFLDPEGNELDGYYIGAFEASLWDASENEYRKYDTWDVTESGGVYTINALDTYLADKDYDKLCSIAGVKPASGKYSDDYTRTGVEQMGRNRGNGWGNINIKMASAEEFIMLIEMGGFNSQATIGKGITALENIVENEAAFTGQTIGNNTGSVSTTNFLQGDGTYVTRSTADTTAVSYRGVENFWGNINCFISGINIIQIEPFICTDYNYAESKTDDNYVSAGITTNANYYITRFGWSDTCDWAFIPTKGESGAYLLPVGDTIDYGYENDKLVHLGGHWKNYGQKGAFGYSYYSKVGSHGQSSGARLTYIPPTYEIGDVIDLSEASYTLQEKDLTAVGFRIYGDENGVGDMFNDVRAVLGVSPSPSTIPAFNSSTYILGHKLYAGDYVDVFEYSPDAYTTPPNGVIANAMSSCTTSTVFSGGSSAMYIKKFSFIYPNT